MEKCTTAQAARQRGKPYGRTGGFRTHASRARPVFSVTGRHAKRPAHRHTQPHILSPPGANGCRHLFHNIDHPNTADLRQYQPQQAFGGDSRRTRNCGNAGGSISAGRMPAIENPAALSWRRNCWRLNGRPAPKGVASARPHAGSVGHNKNRAAIGYQNSPNFVQKRIAVIGRLQPVNMMARAKAPSRNGKRPSSTSAARAGGRSSTRTPCWAGMHKCQTALGHNASA